MKIPSIPFKILALAPLFGPDYPVWDKAALDVDPNDPDRVIAEFGPTCAVAVPSDLYPDKHLELKFTKFKDFHPDNMVQNNPALQNLREAKDWIEKAERNNLSADQINTRLAQWPNLPPIRIETTPRKPQSTSRDSLDKILDIVALPDAHSGLPSGTQAAARQIDTIIKKILKHIFGNVNFRTLEASWRGLHLLLRQVNAGDSDIRIEIAPVSHNSLNDTLAALSVEMIDALPSLILVDLPFDSSPRNLELIESIAQFSETLLVPAITWIRPEFFHIDSWQDIRSLAFLPHYLEAAPFARWQSFKKTPSARWLTVACNRIAARYPYGKDNLPRRIPFEEKHPAWISPVWALGSLIGRSFIEIGWPTRFTDWQTIRLEDLPLNTEDPKKPLPTEANFDRDRTDQFIRCGIIPLAAVPGKDIAFVPDETTTGGISLRYQLFVSRITQLLLWCRDHFEKGIKGADLEAELKQAFRFFWETSGYSGPESLDILVGNPDPDGRVPVRIALESSRQILTSRDKVALDFSW
jgi:type VI secretion system ImpB/VipA family protein